MLAMLKNRALDVITVDDCPMAYDNCLSCPFYCGLTISIISERVEQVRCGWTKKMQEMMTLNKHKNT